MAEGFFEEDGLAGAGAGACTGRGAGSGEAAWWIVPQYSQRTLAATDGSGARQ